MTTPLHARSTTLALSLVAMLAMTACAPTSAPLSAPAGATASTPAASPPLSILWAGNSFFYFNNGMTAHYQQIAQRADPGRRHRGTMLTISGSGLEWHDMASHLRPDGPGRVNTTGRHA